MNKDLLRAFGKASAMNAFPSSQKIDIPVVADQESVRNFVSMG